MDLISLHIVLFYLTTNGPRPPFLFTPTTSHPRPKLKTFYFPKTPTYHQYRSVVTVARTTVTGRV